MLGGKFGVGRRPFDLRRKGGGAAGLKGGGKVGRLGRTVGFEAVGGAGFEPGGVIELGAGGGASLG